LAAKGQKAKKTFVLDTSVLLADPGALYRFAEHEVIIPIAVIGELETKRDHPELGYFARAALRALDDLRITHGRLDKALTITPEGGTLSVELNHTDLSTLPHGFLRDGTNDSRILAIAKNLMSDGKEVTYWMSTPPINPSTVHDPFSKLRLRVSTLSPSVPCQVAERPLGGMSRTCPASLLITRVCQQM